MPRSRRSVKAVLRGRKWRVSVAPGLASHRDGECDYTNRRIHIRPSLEPKRSFEILLHECLHACHWDLSEEAVEQTAADITEVFDRLGYFRKE